jgi:hypothetical protein
MLRHALWPCLFVVVGCHSNKGRDLTVEQLTAVVAAHQAELRPCYQTALDKQPDSQEFRMQATLHVSKNGDVQKVELERGPLPNVGSCIEKTVETWKFPPAEAETYASMPIIFRPTVESMFEAPRNPFENEEKPQEPPQPAGNSQP